MLKIRLSRAAGTRILYLAQDKRPLKMARSRRAEEEG